MNIKKIIFKQAARAITDAKYTGMGVHDGNARIQYYHLEWMMNRIEELEQQLASTHRDATEEVAKAHKRGWEQAKNSILKELSLRVNSAAFITDDLDNPVWDSLSDFYDDISAMEYKGPTK